MAWKRWSSGWRIAGAWNVLANILDKPALTASLPRSKTRTRKQTSVAAT